jgi:hypothetical protein
MKGLFIYLFASLVFYFPLNAQVITVKKTCECTYDGNISSSVQHSSSTFYPGKKYKTYVRVTNVGTCGWGEREVELRVKVFRCPNGSACQREELIPSKWDLNESYIIPKAYEQFIYDWEGPAHTGKFVLQYQVYYDNKPFGDPILTTIEILPAKS